MSADKLAALKLLVAAVRKDAHVSGPWSPAKSKVAYAKKVAPITDDALHAHLNGGPYVAAYPIAAGADTTLVASFDFDDHDGIAGWDCVADAARRVAATTRRFGLNPWSVRSGGGAGIHIWFTWDAPQKATDVRHLLGTILAAEGFESGEGGVAAGEVEINPKQGSIPTEGFGNAVALPFGRASVPLDADMQPVDKPPLIATSATVAAAPPPPEKRGGRKRAVKPDEVRDALTHIPAEEHRMWVLIGLILKATFDDGTAFSLWDAWSRTADKYPGEAAAARQWRSFKPNGSVAIGTLYHLAERAGWSPPPPKRHGAVVLADFLAEMELWQDERHVAYATVTIDAHRENMKVTGTNFRLHLANRFWASQGKPATPEALRQVIEHAAGAALFDSKKIERTWTRTAVLDGKLYLDLGDASWRAVEIDTNGWRVIDDVPVKFIRQASMKPLPAPEHGGTIDELRRFINIGSDDAFKLFVGCLVSYLRPALPVPILFLAGEQGSAKTSALRFAAMLIDPRDVMVGAPKKDIDDLVVTAASRWLVTADNVSYINEEMADAYCRLATGAGLEKRTLYTDEETTSINALRPMAMTGITVATERPDFLDRCMLIELQAFGSEEAPRLDEETLNAEFEKARPRILGALLDGASMALRQIAETRARLIANRTVPRMADAAIFIEAAGAAFGWADDAFIHAHADMLEGLMTGAAEADPVVLAVHAWLRDQDGGSWRGEAKELYVEVTNHKLASLPSDAKRLPKIWPADPARLVKTLLRKKRALAAIGVRYERVDNSHRAQHCLTSAEERASKPEERQGALWQAGSGEPHAGTM